MDARFRGHDKRGTKRGAYGSSIVAPRYAALEFCLLLVRAQKECVIAGCNYRFAAKFILARYACMSLEFIAAGVLVCLFALIALMPPFDGEWDA